MLCANRGSGLTIRGLNCPAQTVDPRFAPQSMDCLRKLWIHALHNLAQSHAPQTKGTGRNRIKGLRSAAQGDVRNLYLGFSGSYIEDFRV